MRPLFNSWVGKICWRSRLPTLVFLSFLGGSVGKEHACNVGDLGSFPVLGRSPGGGKGYPLQYSGLENSKDCIVHGVAKSRTWLRDFNFRILCPARFSLRIEGERKKFSDKQNLEEYRDTEPILKENLKRLVYIEKKQESLRKGKSQ